MSTEAAKMDTEEPVTHEMVKNAFYKNVEAKSLYLHRNTKALSAFEVMMQEMDKSTL